MLRSACLFIALATPLWSAGETVNIVAIEGWPRAAVVVPDDAEDIVTYAAQEFVDHVARATGFRLPVVKESEPIEGFEGEVYIGPTRAAARAGIDVDALPSETFVLRTEPGRLIIAAKQERGNPLSRGTHEAGALWGVYEVLERELGVRWLWPGELGTVVPKRHVFEIGPLDETVPPNYQQRNLRPSLGPKGFATADPRLAFSEEQRKIYAREQSVFLRRHRMGQSADTFFSERKFGSGHAFHGWWEEYGGRHPEWFQLNPDGTRGPGDPTRPKKVSMCVSNPGLAQEVVDRWAEARAELPDEALSIGIGESDGSAMCICEACRAWDDPMPDVATLPAGLERSFEPVQAGARYARFAQRVYGLAAKVDPEVKVHFYAYLNYFWTPDELKVDDNVIIGFVPWFRWAGWFPRTDAEQQWIKEQWTGWQKTGVTAYYRPNWFLDGYSMPHVYMHQFADAFQYYHKNGMIGTDFDSLQGMWAAQGPNLYTLARIHVRPDANIETILDEYYGAFGPAAEAVRKYFQYWEDYSTKNSPRAAEAIKSRRDGMFRRYAHYALAADELYPPEVFPPALALLDEADGMIADVTGSIYADRIRFLRIGLEHALKCVETAAVVNNTTSTPDQRATALAELATYRRSIESTGIANMDRAAIIETDSWHDIDGFTAFWGGEFAH